MKKILVIGSSNTDLIAKVKKFPKSGETIQGTSFMQAMGGKGANQALAAHRLGGEVKFITSLGDDANGGNSLKYYKQQGLDVSASLITEGVASGTAMILVEESGENLIVITPGANHKLSSGYLQKVEKVIDKTDILILQMEIPYETVKTACRLASDKGKKIMLNVAPAAPLDDEILKMVDILVVNETEAETITGKEISKIGNEAIVEELVKMGSKTVVLTLGSKGCLLKTNEKISAFPAFEVKASDTTAAGDTFCGALAAELSRGNDWVEAIKFASAASAICVTRMGAQPSIPAEKEVREFLKNES